MRKRDIEKPLRIPALVIGCLMLLLALASCADNLWENSDTDGKTSEITLEIQTDVPFAEFRTRGDAMGNTDVRSLWVGVYDIQTGNRVGGKHFAYPGSTVALPVLYYDAHPSVVIVGVANYDGATDWSGAALSEKLDAAQTWNDFVELDVRVPLVDGTPSPRADEPQLLMGLLSGSDSQRGFYRKTTDGCVGIDNATGYIVELSPSSLYGAMTKTIEGKKLYLNRLHTQVNVSVISDGDAEVTNISYRRCNMPAGVFLAERATYTGNVKNWNDFSNGTSNFADRQMTVGGGAVTSAESYVSDGENAWIPGGKDNTFSFNHYENKHWGQSNTPGHQEREAFSDKNGTVANLGHPYNNYASYFVVRMTILDKAKGRSARVDYVIHEGNVNDPNGQPESTDARGRDYCAYRNMVYNYNITVNGIDYIDYNVTTTYAHHDAASGVIWEAEVGTIDYRWSMFGGSYQGTITVNPDPELLVRFYVGLGESTAPLDYIDGNVPEYIGGLYWPQVDANTNAPNSASQISNRFSFTKGNRTYNNINDFITEARANGGTFTVTFTPPTLVSQWNTDVYKTSLICYSPNEKSSLTEGHDEDNCTRVEKKKCHVLIWKPAQRWAQTLQTLSLSDFTRKNFVTQYIDIDLRSAHNATTVNSGAEYGIDFVYYVSVNGKDYRIGEDLTCRVPVNEFPADGRYYVRAETLNSKHYNSSAASYGTLTLENPSWNFYDTTFENWFKSNFTSSGRYTATEDILKEYADGLYISLGSGKIIGMVSEDPKYLYFHNSGNKNCVKFTVYKDCIVSTVVYVKESSRGFIVGGSQEGEVSLNEPGKDVTVNSTIRLGDGKDSQEVTLYFSGGGAFIKSVAIN